MHTYHVIITGSRPDKVGNSNRFQPMPEENIKFIESVLSKLDAKGYAALYHGMAKGVDTVADDWAFRNGIRVKQFPAYWYDPTKDGNVDKRAGLFRNEAMVRQALDNAYGHVDQSVVLLAFHSTPTLEESTGTAHCATYAKKKGITVNTFQLPVLKGTVPTQEPLLNPTEANPF